jgi:hypothetical protein
MKKDGDNAPATVSTMNESRFGVKKHGTQRERHNYKDELFRSHLQWNKNVGTSQRDSEITRVGKPAYQPITALHNGKVMLVLNREGSAVDLPEAYQHPDGSLESWPQSENDPIVPHPYHEQAQAQFAKSDLAVREVWPDVAYAWYGTPRAWGDSPLRNDTICPVIERADFTAPGAWLWLSHADVTVDSRVRQVREALTYGKHCYVVVSYYDLDGKVVPGRMQKELLRRLAALKISGFIVFNERVWKIERSKKKKLMSLLIATWQERTMLKWCRMALEGKL